mmetsp:Transcript_12088/g.38456  ORF Transcript_12088/g.38456 Transcript_12088/m.38456 type:complete len:264 (-) Transcript_12088:1029-1820(-)
MRPASTLAAASALSCSSWSSSERSASTHGSASSGVPSRCGSRASSSSSGASRPPIALREDSCRERSLAVTSSAVSSRSRFVSSCERVTTRGCVVLSAWSCGRVSLGSSDSSAASFSSSALSTSFAMVAAPTASFSSAVHAESSSSSTPTPPVACAFLMARTSRAGSRLSASHASSACGSSSSARAFCAFSASEVVRVDRSCNLAWTSPWNCVTAAAVAAGSSAGNASAYAACAEDSPSSGRIGLTNSFGSSRGSAPADGTGSW